MKFSCIVLICIALLSIFCTFSGSNKTLYNDTVYPIDKDSIGCGIRTLKSGGNEIMSLFVGGKEVASQSIPWQVQVNGCGGTLISDKHVLTAAHCTAGKSVSELDVVIGQTVRFPSDGKVYKVCKKAEHPNYKVFLNPIRNIPESTNFDFAILHLIGPVHFNAKVTPACLPKDSVIFAGDFLVNKMMTVSGWGATYQGLFSNSLRSVSLPGISNKRCAEILDPIEPNQIDASHLCVGNLEADHFAGSCGGDSGGPLTYDDGERVTVVGVVSYGPGMPPFDPYSCKGIGRPDVYARVTTALEWIENEIN